MRSLIGAEDCSVLEQHAFGTACGRLELRDRAGLWAAECGSVHVAHQADEDEVLREFAAKAPALGVACEYLSAAEAVRRFPALNPAGLRGALCSPTELAVNPPQAVARLPHFLAETHGVQLRLGVAVARVEMPEVRTAAGEVWRADRVFVCSGSDFVSLFPEASEGSGGAPPALRVRTSADGRFRLADLSPGNHALGVTAPDTWMIGDNLEWEIAAPQRLGIYAIWMDVHGDGLPPGSTVKPDRIIRSLSELLTSD